MSGKNLQEILTALKQHEKRIRALEDASHTSHGQIVRPPLVRDTIENNSVLMIVNKIGDCEESEAIQRKVFDQTGMEAKILLGFYVSYKYFKNAWLTTGMVQKITSDLGIKIDISNISNKIKNDLRKYLESGKVRKSGQPTPYRLNRKGLKRFEDILYAKGTQENS